MENFQYLVTPSSELDISGLKLPVAFEDPRNIILIRHGESEANVLHQALRDGRISAEAHKEILNTPNNHFRLTEKGEQQALELGKWWKENIEFELDRAITSYYVRAEETAGLFSKAAGLDRHIWRATSLVGERYWGNFQNQPSDEQALGYEARKTNARLWTPPNGESLRSLESHARFLKWRMNRKYGMMNVGVVSHGEFITTVGSLFERYTEEQLNRKIVMGIPNCSITHYSRENPLTKEIEHDINWVRRICVWDPKYGDGEWNGEWKKITRPEFSPDDLLNHARSFKRFLSDTR